MQVYIPGSQINVALHKGLYDEIYPDEQKIEGQKTLRQLWKLAKKNRLLFKRLTVRIQWEKIENTKEKSKRIILGIKDTAK